MLKALVIDNYDSFTFNLVQYLGELGAHPLVFRNDAITPEEAWALNVSHLVISPGPKWPQDAGVSVEMIRALGIKGIPILGVCLGHQAIAVAFGGQVRQSPLPVHGKASEILHDQQGLYVGVDSPFAAARYHSLEVDPQLPESLSISAWTRDDTIMGIRHKELPIEGVQFHPESILTPVGRRLMSNFLSLTPTPRRGEE